MHNIWLYTIYGLSSKADTQVYLCKRANKCCSNGRSFPPGSNRCLHVALQTHNTRVTINLHDILYQGPVDGSQSYSSSGNRVQTPSSLLQDIYAIARHVRNTPDATLTILQFLRMSNVAIEYHKNNVLWNWFWLWECRNTTTVCRTIPNN